MKNIFFRLAAVLVSIIIVANLGFWFLVGTEFSSLSNLYRDGTVVKVGPTALVFGHGNWNEEKGVIKHYTFTSYKGELVYTPTLDLVSRLHKEGARWVWGTWCFSGDHSYIEKDIVTGKETRWPRYVSRNKTPGETLPIWLGLGFLRLSIGKPDSVGTLKRFLIPSDTLDTDAWTHRFHDIELDRWIELKTQYQLIQLNSINVEIDSVSGIVQDTIVHDFSKSDRAFMAFEKLPSSVSDKIYNQTRERLQKIKAEEDEEFDKTYSSATKLTLVKVWIRQKPFPIWVKIVPIISYGRGRV